MLGWEECNSTVSENILKASLLSPLYVWMFVTVESFQWSYQLSVWSSKQVKSIKFQERYQAEGGWVLWWVPGWWSVPFHLCRSVTPGWASNLHTNYNQVLSHQPFLSHTSIIRPASVRPATLSSLFLALHTSHPTSDGSQMEKILLIWLGSVSSNKATPIWLICCPEQISYYPSQHNK